MEQRTKPHPFLPGASFTLEAEVAVRGVRCREKEKETKKDVGWDWEGGEKSKIRAQGTMGAHKTLAMEYGFCRGTSENNTAHFSYLQM